MLSAFNNADSAAYVTGHIEPNVMEMWLLMEVRVWNETIVAYLNDISGQSEEIHRKNQSGWPVARSGYEIKTT
jgi:hypothetical protein